MEKTTIVILCLKNRKKLPSLKSSSVERINVRVETITIPNEKKALNYKRRKIYISS